MGQDTHFHSCRKLAPTQWPAHKVSKQPPHLMLRVVPGKCDMGEIIHRFSGLILGQKLVKGQRITGFYLGHKLH